MDIFLGCLFSLIVVYSFIVNPCYCLNRKLFNVSQIQNDNNQWQGAIATWYGPPNGAGSDGGACGYTDSVEKPPLSRMISAGGPSLFLKGVGCGACYEVKCIENNACSGNAVTVMITDECPECVESAHFDLSGTAFGSIASSGNADNLRNAGKINIQFQRVACSFGNSIAFIIDSGANPYYFATEIEYENGIGDIVQVEINQSNQWLSMQRSWGARWALNLGTQLETPFSIRLTESGNGSMKSIVIENVIPSNWQPGQVFRSLVNF
ncbi:putative expansin-B2 [Vicia villosa]|uniref:putative expansin-B2 n=1 Tax=Vicia villosa TaxID=3911 RepID=UPI00273BAA24|nr:putative expansin-B2 [Vicia villosa]